MMLGEAFVVGLKDGYLGHHNRFNPFVEVPDRIVYFKARDIGKDVFYRDLFARHQGKGEKPAMSQELQQTTQELMRDWSEKDLRDAIASAAQSTEVMGARLALAATMRDSDEIYSIEAVIFANALVVALCEAELAEREQAREAANV